MVIDWSILVCVIVSMAMAFFAHWDAWNRYKNKELPEFEDNVLASWTPDGLTADERRASEALAIGQRELTLTFAQWDEDYHRALVSIGEAEILVGEPEEILETNARGHTVVHSYANKSYIEGCQCGDCTQVYTALPMWEQRALDSYSAINYQEQGCTICAGSLYEDGAKFHDFEQKALSLTPIFVQYSGDFKEDVLAKLYNDALDSHQIAEEAQLRVQTALKTTRMWG